MRQTQQHTTTASPIFTNPNFILLWLAYGISAFGDHLSEGALLKLQHALESAVTDTTRRNATMLFVFMAPFVIFGPLFGWLADRLPRKWIMVTCCIARAAIMFELLAVLIGIHRWYEPNWTADAPMPIEVAVAPLAALGLFAAMFSPARLALLSTVVERDQLIRANAATAPLGPIASIAAYVVGPYLFLHYSVNANFRVTSAAFLASALFITTVRPRETIVHVRRPAAWRDFMDSFRYVWSHRRVVEVIAISTIFWAAASVVRSIIPAIVKTVFSGDYQDIGNFQGCLGLGLIGGALVLTGLGSALRSELAASWCLKLAGLCGLVLAMTIAIKGGRGACAVLIFLIGFFGAGIQVSVYALLQRIVPNHLRGRVFGVNDLCSMAGLLLATGFLAIPRWPNIDRYITWIMGTTAAALFASGITATSMRLKRGRFGRRLTFVRNFNEFFCGLMARVRREGICTIPPTGPVIIAANHCSALDPFILHSVSPNRSMGFLIAREYASIPLMRFVIEAIECVPVSRGENDIGSIKAVLRYLEAGKAIGIFPTGRILPRDEPQTPREGIGMIALKSGATVIPAYIDGLKPPVNWSGSRLMDLLSMGMPFMQRHRAVVRFGEPVDLSAWRGREKDREAFKEASEHIMGEVMRLRKRPEA